MQRAYGWAEEGGQVVVTSGVDSTTHVQRSFAPCTVTVYPTGSNTPVPGNQIFSDNGITAKGNPFTSGTNGYWFFYTANGRYDVTLSGAGFPTPFTYGDILLADPQSGPGGVTSVTGGSGISASPSVGAVVVASTTGVFVTVDYNFAAQTPGGSLTIGSNTITLTPVPKGVNGSDTDHRLYISSGIGTAEAVIITGGTAVSEAPTGTVIVTCAHTHSGAWTIQSATAGIQEALVFAGAAPAEVYIPAGTWNIYSTITPLLSGTYHISGAGRGITILSTAYTGGPIFSLANTSNSVLEDFEIDGPSTGSNFAIAIVTAFNVRLQRLKITNVANGISLTGMLEVNAFRDIEIDLPGAGTGVYVSSPGGEAGGTFDRVFIQASAGTVFGSIGFHFVTGVGALIRDCYTNGIMVAVLMAPGNAQNLGVIDFVNNNFDGFTTITQTLGYGIHINPASGGYVSAIRGLFTGGAGFLYGLLIEGTGSKDILFNNGYFVGNNNEGILVGGSGPTAVTGLSLIDCWVEGNNDAGGAADGANIAFVTDLTIRGGVYGANSYANGANTQTHGISLASITNALIDGPVVSPNLSGTINIGAGNTGVIIQHATGYNPVGQSAISVGASPFTYTAGTSPEVVYIFGGTVSSIKVGTTQVAAASPAQITLYPNEALTVTYSVVPTMIKDIQ